MARHVVAVASIFSFALLVGCGSDKHGSDAPSPVSQVENSAYLTDEGKLYFLPVVGGVGGAPQLVSDGLPVNSTLPSEARKVFNGTRDPSSGALLRARYSDVVYLDGSQLKKLDLQTLAPSPVTLTTVDEACKFLTVAVDLMNHENSLIHLLNAGPDHDCDTSADTGHFLVRLSADSGRAMPGNLGIEAARDGAGAITALFGGMLTADSLELDRFDPTTFQPTELLTATDLGPGRRFSRGLGVGPLRTLIGIYFRESDTDRFYLFDDAGPSARELYRVDHPTRRKESTSPLITEFATFDDPTLYLVDKSAIVSLDPSADPVSPQTLVDFGAGNSIEQIVSVSGQIVAVVRGADGSYALSRINSVGASEIARLPAGLVGIVEFPGDVLLINSTAVDGTRKALAYDAANDRMASFADSRWIGGASVTTPTRGIGLSRVVEKVGETGLEVEAFGSAYLLATLSPDHTDLKLVRRDSIDSPIALPVAVGPIETGRMDDLGQHVLVDLTVDRGAASDHDIYLLDIGTPPSLVPIAAVAGRNEYLVERQLH